MQQVSSKVSSNPKMNVKTTHLNNLLCNYQHVFSNENSSPIDDFNIQDSNLTDFNFSLDNLTENKLDLSSSPSSSKSNLEYSYSNNFINEATISNKISSTSPHLKCLNKKKKSIHFIEYKGPLKKKVKSIFSAKEKTKNKCKSNSQNQSSLNETKTSSYENSSEMFYDNIQLTDEDLIAFEKLIEESPHSSVNTEQYERDSDMSLVKEFELNKTEMKNESKNMSISMSKQQFKNSNGIV